MWCAKATVAVARGVRLSRARWAEGCHLDLGWRGIGRGGAVGVSNELGGCAGKAGAAPMMTSVSRQLLLEMHMTPPPGFAR